MEWDWGRFVVSFFLGALLALLWRLANGWPRVEPRPPTVSLGGGEIRAGGQVIGALWDEVEDELHDALRAGR